MTNDRIYVPLNQRVQVDPGVPPSKIFENIGYKTYVDPRHLSSIPDRIGDVTVHFFQVPVDVFDTSGIPILERLRAEYANRCLVSDPRAHAQANLRSGDILADRDPTWPTNASFFLSEAGVPVYVIFGWKDAWPAASVGERAFPWHEPCLVFAGISA